MDIKKSLYTRLQYPAKPVLARNSRLFSVSIISEVAA
jgi:hypothetical protein